jgi:broad specificity phosphatase PhoE
VARRVPRRRIGTLIEMPRVLLIRHGETDWSRDGRWQGHVDVPLNATGHRQAADLAEALADRAPALIACSDLTRARETIKPLAERLGLEPVVEPGLREIDVGSWAGLSREEATERFPEGAARHAAGGTGWEDGETYGEVAVRGLAALERLLAPLGPDDTAVVIAHGALIGATAGRILGLDPDEQRRRLGRSSHGNAATFEYRPDAPVVWRVLAYNAPIVEGDEPTPDSGIH